MKKVALVLGLVLLLFAFSYAGAGSGQMGREVKELQKEIKILTLINLAGLNKPQMVTLRDMIKGLRASQEEMMRQELSVRDFLLDFQGSPEQFKEAFAPFEERLKEAHRAFEEKLKQSVEQIKETLTIKQGEIIRDFLMQEMKMKMMPYHPLMEKLKGLSPEAMERMKEMMEAMEEMGLMERREMMGMMRVMERVKERMEKMRMEKEAGSAKLKEFFLENLELLERVLTEKIQRTRS